MSARSNAAAVDEQATVTLRLHGVQHDINNLRLLNVCLQSTLLRVQTQLTDCLPANADDEIKRNCVKQTIASLRAADDRNRRVVLRQQRSLAQLFGYFSKSSQVTARVKQCSLDKSENQVELLHSMFLELHAVIHTEHNDRINQMYIALTETSKSVQQAQESKTSALADRWSLVVVESSARQDDRCTSTNRPQANATQVLLSRADHDVYFEFGADHRPVDPTALEFGRASIVTRRVD